MKDFRIEALDKKYATFKEEFMYVLAKVKKDFNGITEKDATEIALAVLADESLSSRLTHISSFLLTDIKMDVSFIKEELQDKY